MAQVILYCFSWILFRDREGKDIGVSLIFSIYEAALVVFLWPAENQADCCSLHSTQLI